MRLLFIKTYLLLNLCLLTHFCAANTQEQTVLSLNDSDTIYHLNSAKESKGFYLIPEHIDNVFAYTEKHLLEPVNKNNVALTTRPTFSNNQRYALYIPIQNNTQDKAWHIHISHYLIDKVTIFIKTKENVEQITIASTTTNSITYDINMLGRSAHLNLPNSEYTELIVAFENVKTKQPIYVGLMSEAKYQDWKRNLDFLFIVALGVVLGFVLLALVSFMLARDRTFLWFALSTTLLLCISLVRSPLGLSLFETQEGVPIWIWLMIGLTLITLLLFVASFLSVERYTKTYNAFAAALILVSLVMILSLFSDNSFNIKMFSISALLAVLLIITVGIIKAMQGGILYVVFMLGWLPLCYSISLSIYLQITVPKPNEVTLNYHDLLGVYFQMIHFFLHFVAMVLKVLTIRKEKIEAESKSNAKTQFLAQLSHDLRQPIDTMGLLLSQAKAIEKNKESKDLLSKISTIQKDMQETFRSLIDASELESGSTKVRLECFELNSVFQELHSSHEDNFLRENLSLKYINTDIMLHTDRALLKRLLNNLLNNANKYTTTGGALFNVRVRKTHILIQVWDTGAGISVKRQESLFNMFERAGESNPQGHGIGLASAKYIADLLGFELILRSIVDKGSVFSLRIPVSALAQEKEDSPHQIAVAPDKKVLIIKHCEDLELANLIDNFCHSWGYQICSIHNAEVIAQANTIFLFIRSDTPQSLDSVLASLTLSKEIEQKRNRVVACFSTDAENMKTHVSTIHDYTVHILHHPPKPAQVRSLLNSIKAQL